MCPDWLALLSVIDWDMDPSDGFAGGIGPGSPPGLPELRQLWNEDHKPTLRVNVLHSGISFAACQAFGPERATSSALSFLFPQYGRDSLQVTLSGD